MEETRAIVCCRCRHEIVVREDSLGGEIICPVCQQQTVIAALAPTSDVPSAREVYNVVSDIAIGVNVRRRDNLIQAAVIGVSLSLGILIGAMVVQDRVTGAVVGGFIGLLAGLFGSGIFLMIYRLICHIRGDHK